MSLRVGTSVQDITPKPPVALSGHPYLGRTATSVNDSLLASAIHLRCDNVGVTIVALDLLGLDPATARRIRQAITAATAVPEDRVFISCTHTHSGPVVNNLLCWADDATAGRPDANYLEFVKDKAVFAAAHASATTRPAEIAWTTAAHDVGVLGIREERGGPFEAILVICDMPPAFLDEKVAVVSADFPYHVRRHLQGMFREDLAVLCLTAPCVDASFDPRWGGCSLEEVEKLGTDLGQAVGVSLGRLGPSDYSSDIVLQGRRSSVRLPLRAAMPSPLVTKARWTECRAEYERLRTGGVDKATLRVAALAVAEARGIMNIASARKNNTLAGWGAPNEMAEVQVVQVGQMHLAGMPGVLFRDYGRAVRDASNGKVFAVSLVNGDLQGYTVTSQAAASVKFGLMASPFDSDAGSLMLNAVRSLIPNQ